MSKMSIDWDGEKNLKVSGHIDELANFEPYVEAFGPEVWIDMADVTRINSGGVRQWAKAVSISNAVLHYTQVSPAIVDQLSMIPEFLGNRGIVDSFMAHYNCNGCGYDQNFVFTVGVDVERNLEDYGEGPVKPCPKCRQRMEIDHNPDLFFEFLKVG